MTNYREILRLHSLGLNKTEIASSCQCARNTVAATMQRAANCGLQWPLPEEMSDKQLSERLFPTSPSKPVYKMPDYDYVHKELQRSGVTLNLLWLEYCDQCRAADETPYQSTQFNKYYADYLAKVNATMHLNHKPGEVMQVDWVGDTAAVIDTDTGEIIPAYVFVATLPYSGYSYVEAFFSMNQESWTAAHVNAYKYFRRRHPNHPVRQPENRCAETRERRGCSQQIVSGSGAADKAYHHLQGAKAAV